MIQFKSQNNLLYWLTGGLLVINILCLAIIWTLIIKSDNINAFDKHHHDKKDPMRMLKEELKLSQDQVKKFEEERVKYFSQIDSLIPELNRLRAVLIEKLTVSEPDSSEPDELIKKVGALEANLEELRLHHFKNLFYLCTKDQQVIFKNIVKKLLSKKPPSDKPPGKKPD